MYANYKLVKATTAIIIDKRKPLKTGKYPIKLRVTFDRKQRYYPANISFTDSEYSKLIGKNPKGEFKRWKLKLEALEQKANTIIDNMPVFDFILFKKALYSEQLVREDVYTHYERYIKELKEYGQFGTASNYQSSLNSLKDFRKKLTFIDVTVDFLKSYDKWLINRGKSVSTVGIYLRPLRAIINRAKGNGTLSQDYNYPFGSKNKQKYQIPTSRNIKKALTKSEIELIFKYDAEDGSWEQKAADFWIFTYLANGMNMKDIAQLRYKDIDSNYIKFIRAKTRNTSRVVAAITILLSDDLKRIILRWGNAKVNDETLVFPIINLDETGEKQRAKIRQFIKMVNKYMKQIAEKVGINKPCTTYCARHSFSTVLKRADVSVQRISELLGHSSIATTKAYLDNFEDEDMKETAKALTAF